MFSSCPYCHIVEAAPSLLTNVAPGTTHAMITGIASESRKDGKTTSARVLKEEQYAPYMNFIEHFNTLEIRLNRMSGFSLGSFPVDLVPRIAGREHRFIDVVWTDRETKRCGYLMKLLE